MDMFGPPLTSSAAFRDQAARCRRLADELGNDGVSETLLLLARENDQRAFYAAEIERKAAKDIGWEGS